jgi:hypothetical protein
LNSICIYGLDNSDREAEINPAMDAQTGSSVVLRCPGCRTKVVVRGPGEVVIHNAILRVDASTERVSAKCPRCKAWVEVPLRFVG